MCSVDQRRLSLRVTACTRDRKISCSERVEGEKFYSQAPRDEQKCHPRGDTERVEQGEDTKELYSNGVFRNHVEDDDAFCSTGVIYTDKRQNLLLCPILTLSLPPKTSVHFWSLWLKRLNEGKWRGDWDFMSEARWYEAKMACAFIAWSLG